MPREAKTQSRLVVELHQSCAEKLAEVMERTDRNVSSLLDVAEAIGAPELSALLGRFGSPPSVPLIPHQSVREQAKRPDRGLFDLFAIDTAALSQPDRDRLREALQSLNQTIASAEFEPTYGNTSRRRRSAPIAPWQDAQTYLECIGITPAWSNNGRGVGFAVVEQDGWYLGHEAFRGYSSRWPIKPRHPANGPLNAAAHGTSSVSIVLANPSSGKIRGIAFEAELKELVCSNDQPSVVIYSLVEQQRLEYGDVLLLEIETHDGLPVEVFPATLRAIQFAVSHGIVVVEPAGNGRHVRPRHGWDLDGLNDNQSRAWRNADGSPRQSGAILVSACSSTPNHDGEYPPLRECNFGSRVDCYAPGDGVLAATTLNQHNLNGYSVSGTAGTSDENAYDGSFSDTSAAAAIVAGVLLVTQGMARDVLGEVAPRERVWPLSPQQIRKILRDRREPMGALVARHPGAGPGPTLKNQILPDLKRIAARIPSLPQIRIRAHLRDDRPSIGKRRFGVDAQSPDIIVRTARVADSVGEYGPLSRTAKRVPPSDTIRRGHEAYIYLRLRNVGDADASNVRASAYWTHHAEPGDKVIWHTLADLEGIDVPLESDLVVTSPIVWTMPERIAADARQIDILVIVGDEKWDPRPELPLLRAGGTPRSRSDLHEFLLANRSVAWRTIHCT